jgi:hypothetical protein
VDKRADLTIAIATSMLGVVILVLTRRVSTRLVIDPVGSRAFGYFISGALIVGGITLAIRRIRTWREDPDTLPSEGAGDEPGVPASAVRPVVIVALTFIYIWSLDALGFILATPIYLGVMLWILQSKRPVISRVIGPMVFTVIVYATFAQGLSVRIPVGPLRSLFVEWGLVSF